MSLSLDEKSMLYLSTAIETIYYSSFSLFMGRKLVSWSSISVLLAFQCKAFYTDDLLAF